MSTEKGLLAEHEAKSFLEEQGLVTITSNFRSRMGEIDLIMRDGTDLVFVEVRARSSQTFSGALASITPSKQYKLLKTAAYFLYKYPLANQLVCRFDILCIDTRKPLAQDSQKNFSNTLYCFDQNELEYHRSDHSIRWIKYAFDASDVSHRRF